MSPSEPRRTPRYGAFAGLLLLVIVVLIAVNVAHTKTTDVRGIAPGEPLAPFAVPLALGTLSGDADTATHADDGPAGRVPACQERGGQILNICQLYEQGPVVLALFVDSGSCPRVLGDLQTVSSSFPGVRFAAVAIKGQRGSVRRLIHARGLTFPVGIDSDGALAALYKVASCPQISFAYRGGVVQSAALLTRPSLVTLRTRVQELVTASAAQSGKAPASR